MVGRTRYNNPIDALVARSMPVTESGCIIWTGALDSKGYGQIVINNKKVPAHRFAWEIETKEQIPENLRLDHKDHCSKSCINPDHLRLATHAQNVQNQASVRSDNTSGYRGISWQKAVQKWRVRIGTTNFGHYSDLEEAIRVRDKAREEMYGEFAGKG